MTKSAKKRSKSQAIAKTKPLTHSEEVKLQKQKDEALKQTLQYLQDRIKRHPDLYKNEFVKHWAIFKEKMDAFKENPAKKEEQFNYYILFFGHISHKYKEEIVGYLPNELLNILQQYYSILNPETRFTMVTCLKIFRGKDLVAPQVILPVLFKLFKCKDKELRKFLHNGLISDLKRLNQDSRNNSINKKMQTFIFEMLQDPNETASKRSLAVMIELYKRKIWNDDKTVNVIAEGVLHSNPKIIAAASKFFLVLDYDWESDSEGGDSSDEEQEQKAILGKYKGTKKMTKSRMAKVDKVIKQHKRKEKRRNKVKYSTDFLPIDLIFDPQSFVEKLFNKLRKSTDQYEVKLLMMRLISRMVGRHQLIALQFYPFLLRYLQSHEKDKIGEIFAMIIESCHELIPPEEIKPIIEKIISNFITEYCNNKHITIGLNAIREILLRMPLALDESQIEYLIAFRSFRNSSVVNAAKSLINYFRDVCPQLLPKKYRGRFTNGEDADKKEDMVFGRQKLNFDVDGIELLAKHEGFENAESLTMSRVLTDDDFKMIRRLKMKDALKGVIKEKEVKKDEDDDEEAEDDIEGDEEDGELEIDEGDIEEGDELQDDSDIDDEEGEDEFEDDDEEGEQDFEDDDEEGEDESEDNEVLSQSESGSDDIDLPEEQSDSEAENPHGFVYARTLDTFKKTKREKIEQQKKEREDTKDERKAQFKKRDKKKGGKTNKQQLKNKPFNMVKPKKLESISERFQSTKSKLKRLRVQLGKYKKTQKSKLDSKKRNFRQR